MSQYDTDITLRSATNPMYYALMYRNKYSTNNSTCTPCDGNLYVRAIDMKLGDYIKQSYHSVVKNLD